MKRVILAGLTGALVLACSITPKAASVPTTDVSSADPVIVPYTGKTIEECLTKQKHVTPEKSTIKEVIAEIERNRREAERDRAGDNGADPAPCEDGEEAECVSSGDREDEAEWEYYGECRITHYDDCEECCGIAGNTTASGVYPTPNHTVATGEDLPFGTEIMIDGQVYVIEDRGVDPYQIDIFVPTHDEAVARGMYYTDVYVRYQ